VRIPGFKQWAAAAILAAGALTSSKAYAEIAEVRIAETFGIAFLQIQVMKHENLIEKHAAKLGISDLKVTWQQFAGAGAVNDALLSGSVEFAAAGVPGFLVLHDRTRNLPNPVVGVSSFGSIPNLLNSNDPNVKSVRDFNDTHKIAVPSLKVSIQAILLQMAAAKEFGKENFAKFDHLTVAMPAPESAAALASGVISASFSTPPFQNRQLETPGVHTVTSSFEILDGPASLIILYSTEKVRSDNPKVFAAVLGAMEEATDFINADKRRAAEIYKTVSNDNTPTDELLKMIEDPDFIFTTTPHNVLKYAQFMHETGIIKNEVSSWQELFVPEVHHLSGG